MCVTGGFLQIRLNNKFNASTLVGLLVFVSKVKLRSSSEHRMGTENIHASKAQLLLLGLFN